MGIQSEINLHKPRKNAVNASWSQKGALMTMGNLNSQYTPWQLGLGEKLPLLVL